MNIVTKIREEAKLEVYTEFKNYDIYIAPAFMLKQAEIIIDVKQHGDELILGLLQLTEVINKYKNCRGFYLAPPEVTHEYCKTCYRDKDSVDFTSYVITRSVWIARNKVNDIIKSLTKEKLRARLCLDTGLSTVYLDCKVMELYKSGIISWEAVVDSHKHACNI